MCESVLCTIVFPSLHVCAYHIFFIATCLCIVLRAERRAAASRRSLTRSRPRQLPRRPPRHPALLALPARTARVRRRRQLRSAPPKHSTPLHCSDRCSLSLSSSSSCLLYHSVHLRLRLRLRLPLYFALNCVASFSLQKYS